MFLFSRPEDFRHLSISLQCGELERARGRRAERSEDTAAWVRLSEGLGGGATLILIKARHGHAEHPKLRDNM